MSVVLAIAGYVFGAAVCATVFAAIGDRRQKTYGDSWTGDDALDMWSVIMWPLSLIIGAGILAGRMIARVAVG